MSVYCFAECLVECESKEDLDKIKTNIFTETFIKETDITELYSSDNEIHFKVTGNHYIDFSFFDDLKKFVKENNIKITINCGEYVESDGYYWDNEVEE